MTTENNNLKWALWYAETMGFSVIPIIPGEKKPLIKWEPFQNRRATKVEITSWWSINPTANIGIVTGPISNLAVVDIDTDEGKEEILKYIPDSIVTPTTQTPKGGNHLYFSYPANFEIGNNTKIITGCDFRGKGGYVVAPPSVNGNGKQYEWVIPFDGQSELMQLPTAYINKISTFNRGDYKGGDKNLTLQNKQSLQFLQEGTRDNDIFHVLNCLSKGGLEKDLALKVAKIIGNSCNPPFPEKEAIAKVESAYNRKEKKERNLMQEVRDYISLQDSYIFLTEAYETLQTLQASEKSAMQVAFHRLCKEGIIEKTGRGAFKKIAPDCLDIDLWSADATPLKIKYPLGVHDLVVTHPKNIIIIAGEPNAGKGHPHGTKLLSDNGWINVENAKIGDILYSENGEKINIENIFNRGEQDCYKFIFNDGTSIESDSDHIWSILDGYRRKHKTTGHNNTNVSYGEYRLRTTQEIVDYCGIGKVKEGKRFVLPQLKPIQYEEKAVPLDPYLMGVLLGDGGLTQTSIKISSMDKEILDNFCKNGFSLTLDQGCNYRVLDMIPIIKKMKLHGLKSNEKFVPKEYLYNSINNRIAILSGLMDTDGHIASDNKRVSIEFCSVSKQLAEDVIFLVRSLGGRAVCSIKYPTYTHKGEKRRGQLAYRVSIKINGICPFRINRKANQFREGMKRDGKIIREIEYTGRKKTICIKVSNPTGLYVAQDFIITHNTAWLLNFAQMNCGRDYEVVYFSSEMGAVELQARLKKFNLPMDEWRKIVWKERASDFASVIRPNAINIIDFLEVHDEFYKIGLFIKQIFDRLDQGIAVIALQKNKGRDEGMGGMRSVEKARLYMAMEPGKLKIVKAKNWRNDAANPNGLIKYYKLVAGCNFKTEGDWQKAEDSISRGFQPRQRNNY